MGIPVTASLSKKDRVRIDKLIEIFGRIANKELNITWKDKVEPSIEGHFGRSGIDTTLPDSE